MKLVLVGARVDGQAHLVLDMIAQGVPHEVVAFLDETPELAGTRVHGIPVLGPPSEIGRALDLGAEGGMVCIGLGAARERLGAVLAAAGLALPTLVHPRAEIAPSAELGRGIFVGALSVVNSGARIGDLALLSPTSFVGHHAVVGEAASLAPGGRMGGRSRLGRRAFIGLSGSILPDCVVGDDVVVGAGAVVIENVESGATVVGAPARVVAGGPGA